MKTLAEIHAMKEAEGCHGFWYMRKDEDGSASLIGGINVRIARGFWPAEAEYLAALNNALPKIVEEVRLLREVLSHDGARAALAEVDRKLAAMPEPKQRDHWGTQMISSPPRWRR